MHFPVTIVVALIFSNVSSTFCANQTTTKPWPFSYSPSPFLEVKREDVDRCFDRLVLRIRALNGPFFTQEQGVHVKTKGGGGKKFIKMVKLNFALVFSNYYFFIFTKTKNFASNFDA